MSNISKIYNLYQKYNILCCVENKIFNKLYRNVRPRENHNKCLSLVEVFMASLNCSAGWNLIIGFMASFNCSVGYIGFNRYV